MLVERVKKSQKITCTFGFHSKHPSNLHINKIKGTHKWSNLYLTMTLKLFTLYKHFWMNEWLKKWTKSWQFDVLFCLGYCNKIPYTVWLMNSRHFVLMTEEAGKSKIQLIQWLVSTHFMVHKQPSSLCMGRRGRGILESL